MMVSRGPSTSDEYSEKEAQERFEATLRGGLKTPHKPLKEKPTKREVLGKVETKPTKAKKSQPRRRSESGAVKAKV
jgi:hypothetical protein